MDIWTFVGIMGIVFTSAQTFPQIIKSLRSRELRDLSGLLCCIVSASSLCWLSYGIHLADKAIIIANGINAAGAMFLLLLKLRYEIKNKETQP